MKLASPIAILVSLLAMPAIADDPFASQADHRIVGAQFEAVPDARNFIRYYPERAQKERVEGYAKLKCMVTDQGRLAECSVTEEAPTGYEFGQAAIDLSPLFKLRPATTDGKPVAGGVFYTKINFKLAQ